MPAPPSRPAARLCATLLVLAACALTGCSRDTGSDSAMALPTQPSHGDIDEIRQRKLLRALVAPSRTDFFLSGARIEGLQARLLLEYEAHLNRGIERAEDKVRVRFLPVTFERLLPELLAGQGDIAAALLTVTPEREARVAIVAAGSMPVDEVVVRHRDAAPIERVEDLAGREVQVLRGSSYAEHLRALNGRLGDDGLAPVQIVEADPQLRSEDIVELVNAGVVPLTVIDDYKARLWSKVYKDVVVHEAARVHAGGRVGWAVRRQNVQLLASLGEFLKRVRHGTLPGKMLTQSFPGQTGWITNPSRASDRERVDRFTPLFERYGQRFGLDPLALMALAYHESGLDPDRRSARGAVGLMQLMPSTAADPHIGIAHIQLPENNVHAAAKYLAFLFGQVEVAAGRLVGAETVKYVADIRKYVIAYRLLRAHEKARPAMP